ncbi:MAG: hypothetical protein AB7P31_11470 [Steroidobacteraceae bacterium]
MRQLDGQRRSTGRPTLNERTALSDSMAGVEARRASPEPTAHDEARAAWQARGEIRAGHARTLTTGEVERELELGPA